MRRHPVPSGRGGIHHHAPTVLRPRVLAHPTARDRGGEQMAETAGERLRRDGEIDPGQLDVQHPQRIVLEPSSALQELLEPGDRKLAATQTGQGEGEQRADAVGLTDHARRLIPSATHREGEVQLLHRDGIAGQLPGSQRIMRRLEDRTVPLGETAGVLRAGVPELGQQLGRARGALSAHTAHVLTGRRAAPPPPRRSEGQGRRRLAARRREQQRCRILVELAHRLSPPRGQRCVRRAGASNMRPILQGESDARPVCG